jgi:hypothetical protein
MDLSALAQAFTSGLLPGRKVSSSEAARPARGPQLANTEQIAAWKTGAQDSTSSVVAINAALAVTTLELRQGASLGAISEDAVETRVESDGSDAVVIGVQGSPSLDTIRQSIGASESSSANG